MEAGLRVGLPLPKRLEAAWRQLRSARGGTTHPGGSPGHLGIWALGHLSD